MTENKPLTSSNPEFIQDDRGLSLVQRSDWTQVSEFFMQPSGWEIISKLAFPSKAEGLQKGDVAWALDFGQFRLINYAHPETLSKVRLDFCGMLSSDNAEFGFKVLNVDGEFQGPKLFKKGDRRATLEIAMEHNLCVEEEVEEMRIFQDTDEQLELFSVVITKDNELQTFDTEGLFVGFVVDPNVISRIYGVVQSIRENGLKQDKADIVFEVIDELVESLLRCHVEEERVSGLLPMLIKSLTLGQTSFGRGV